MACWAVECLSCFQVHMDRSTPGGLGTAPEGRRHKNQQDAGNARCSRGARSSCRPRPCACARPRAAASASRASSCSSRSRPCRRPPARPTIRSPCACGCLTRRQRGGVRGSAVGSLVGSTIGSAARPPRQSTDRKVRASRRRRGVGSTAGSAGVRATEHRRERLDAAKVRREVARLVPEGHAALGHARVVLLEGPGDEAPRPLRLDELERGPVRALLVGVAALPRLALGILARFLVRAEAPPPPAAARLARELVRQVDLLGQVALLALFVGVAVGDRPRRRDAPRSPAFCSGSRRWRRCAAPR